MLSFDSQQGDLKLTNISEKMYTAAAQDIVCKTLATQTFCSKPTKMVQMVVLFDYS